ncbi:MAG TPA: VOC family protein [Bacteroidia bacterium]|nr:VOC family protein [Bacteroidia bacterium]
MSTITSPKITPFLWFDKEAEDAMKFYCSVFKNSKVKNVSRSGKDGPVFSVSFELEGQPFHAFNAGPMFKFNESISFFVNCEDQKEVDYFWNKFTADGGQESRCGWLKDKFGLSWQIVPRHLGELMNDKDAAKAKRVVDSMMGMKKIIIADLEKAYQG